NEGLYPDAFTDFEADAVHADLLYKNSPAMFEQLVVIRQQLPSPAEWGLTPDSTVLQVITAFDDPPQPQISEIQTPQGIDQQLDFGGMKMCRGIAFALGAKKSIIPVTKRWI